MVTARNMDGTTELAVLPDKVSRYLFEFDFETYASLALPDIPRGASSGTIHGLMNAQQLCCLHISHLIHILRILHITEIRTYIAYL